MTLDDLPGWIAERLERERTRIRDFEDDQDAGSVEAEEAMAREHTEWMRTHQPWRFTEPDRQVSVDARLFPSAGTDEVECWRHPVVPDVPGAA